MRLVDGRADATVRQDELLVARPRSPPNPGLLSGLDSSAPRRRPPFPGVPTVGCRVCCGPQGDRRSDDRLSRDGPREPATSRRTDRPDYAIWNRIARLASEDFGL